VRNDVLGEAFKVQYDPSSCYYLMRFIIIRNWYNSYPFKKPLKRSSDYSRCYTGRRWTDRNNDWQRHCSKLCTDGF